MTSPLKNALDVMVLTFHRFSGKERDKFKLNEPCSCHHSREPTATILVQFLWGHFLWPIIPSPSGFPYIISDYGGGVAAALPLPSRSKPGYSSFDHVRWGRRLPPSCQHRVCNTVCNMLKENIYKMMY
uniref:S100/CaBP-9k-type calcium binding subdomain domain-containing protein n=1 Tax=Salvator merianae TaxID=96440 RepID=A0A8D0DZ09_SALMN